MFDIYTIKVTYLIKGPWDEDSSSSNVLALCTQRSTVLWQFEVAVTLYLLYIERRERLLLLFLQKYKGGRQQSIIEGEGK